MAWWFMRRRRARSGADADSSKQTPHDMLLDGAEKGGSSGGAPQPKVNLVYNSYAGCSVASAQQLGLGTAGASVFVTT